MSKTLRASQSPRRVIASAPMEAYAVSADYKPERREAPRLPYSCFQNMPTVDAVDSIRATAPDLDREYGIRARKPGQAFVPQPRSLPPRAQVTIAAAAFSRGRTVKDKSNGRTGIIIKANAGFTKKSHTPVHEIVDHRGHKWYGKEKDLRLKD
jgi:hypothetical protein